MKDSLLQGVLNILTQGGFVMPPLVLLSLILFTSLFRLIYELLHLSKAQHPANLAGARNRELAELESATLAQARAQWGLHFDRRLKFVAILTTTAPLLGLLGTVAGMLKTFSALSLREGLDSIDLVASGISEALITTETGLSIAITGLVLTWALKSFRKRLFKRFQVTEAAITLAQFSPPAPSC